MTPRDEQNVAPADRGICRARPTFPALATRTAALRRLPAPVTEVWDWHMRGACLGVDGGMFFHPDGERGSARAAREERAKHVCGTCPVPQQRRRHTLSVREPYGMWGGLSESERDALVGRASRSLRVISPGSAARPVDPAPMPGPARNNRGGSANTERAAGDAPQGGVIELAAPAGAAVLRLVAGPRDAVAVMAWGRWHPHASSTTGARAAAVSGAVALISGRTLICGSREEPPQQLTVAEVAAMLRVSRATVYRLVHSSHLPGVRVGRSVRISRVAVEKYLRDAAMGGPGT